MEYVLLDSTDTVVNVIVYDGVARYQPPAGCTLMTAPPGTGIGWKWDGLVFKAPT